MTTETRDPVTDGVLESNQRTQDAMSARRVFGQSYEAGGRTIIPVAHISGGGGGGGGEGTESDDSGRGFGSGFGLTARPVGVYEVTESGVDWKPALDVTCLAKRGQVLAGICAVCLTIFFWSRRI